MSDFPVPPAATLELHHALVAAQVDVDLHLYHGHTHEFASLPSMLEPVHAEITSFLRRAVVDRAGHIAENLELNPFPARIGALPVSDCPADGPDWRRCADNRPPSPTPLPRPVGPRCRPRLTFSAKSSDLMTRRSTRP